MGRDVVPGFGDDVRAARDGMGWSRRDLAERVGSSYSGLTQIERGERSVSLAVAVKLARALDLDLNKYVGGEK
jgi:transcriptional regulator with XRE-family HTH domain